MWKGYIISEICGNAMQQCGQAKQVYEAGKWNLDT